MEDSNTYNQLSIRRGTSGEECRQARHFPRLLLTLLLIFYTPRLPKASRMKTSKLQEMEGECGVCLHLHPPSHIYRWEPWDFCREDELKLPGTPILQPAAAS